MNHSERQHEVKNLRSSLSNHVHLSFADFNIPMPIINIIDHYEHLLWYTRRLSLNTALLLGLTNISLEDDFKLWWTWNNQFLNLLFLKAVDTFCFLGLSVGRLHSNNDRLTNLLSGEMLTSL